MMGNRIAGVGQEKGSERRFVMFHGTSRRNWHHILQTQPSAAAVRALINKQHNQASHVVAVLSFDQNMPRAPHVAPVCLGPPEQVTGRQQDPRGAKQALDLAAQLRRAHSLSPHRQTSGYYYVDSDFLPNYGTSFDNRRSTTGGCCAFFAGACIHHVAQQATYHATVATHQHCTC
jgi:hypothetical protein